VEIIFKKWSLYTRAKVDSHTKLASALKNNKCKLAKKVIIFLARNRNNEKELYTCTAEDIKIARKHLL
jgi:hypothetical protein